MRRFDSPLENIRIASPCQANWNEMFGDERKRFCGECKLNVYNLSGMTRDEAERLIFGVEGRLCVRYYRRPDGSVITQDCPVGLAKLRQRTRVYLTAALSLIMAMLSGIFVASMFSRPKNVLKRIVIPFSTPTPEPLMGAIAISPKDLEKQPYRDNSNVVMGEMPVRERKPRS